MYRFRNASEPVQALPFVAQCLVRLLFFFINAFVFTDAKLFDARAALAKNERPGKTKTDEQNRQLGARFLKKGRDLRSNLPLFDAHKISKETNELASPMRIILQHIKKTKGCA